MQFSWSSAVTICYLDINVFLHENECDFCKTIVGVKLFWLQVYRMMASTVFIQCRVIFKKSLNSETVFSHKKRITTFSWYLKKHMAKALAVKYYQCCILISFKERDS